MERDKESVLPERLFYLQVFLLWTSRPLCRYAAQKTNTAILLVTHDITLAESICDTIAVMCDGKIIEQGETFQILHSPKNTYTKRLIAAGTDIESYLSLQDEVS